MATMGPSQAAAELRRIAASLDDSKNPDRRLVVGAIGRVLTAIDQNTECGECGKTWGKGQPEKHEEWCPLYREGPEQEEA